jgi:hypothetical protein
MPEILSEALALQGLWLLILGALVAGIVRGFSGFGTAMIYLPVAAQVMPPIWAILSLVMMDVFGPLPIVPRALRTAHRRDLVLLLVGTLCLLPVGLALLALMTGETYRYIVCILSLALVACLALGVRYQGKLTPPLVGGIGALAGFSGGLSGVPGPPVILFYMASALPVAVVRANVLLYLFAFDFLLVGVLALRGDLVWLPVVIGLLLAIPSMIGNLIGAAIFNPDKAGVYRGVAYVVVASSAIMGLPVWGN